MSGDTDMTPLLKTNFDEEDLEDCGPSFCSVQPSKHHEKLIKYDDQHYVGFAALWSLRGTYLVSSTIWLTCSVYWVLCALMVALGWFLHERKVPLDSPENVAHFETLAGYFTALIGFMLGMFVSTLVGRWWSVRNNCIGGLWGAIDDLNLILAIHMPSPNDRPLKENVLRLCLLSHRLVYNQAQGKEKRHDLEKHVHRGLMTTEELDILEHEASKSQTVWVWIGQLIHKIANEGKIKYKEMLVPQLDILCTKARGSIGQAFAYTDTQLPLPYVHMLATAVIISNFLVALKCGLVIGRVLGPNTQMNYLVLAVQICHVVVIPFFYHAFLNLGSALANPLQKDFTDFPDFAFHVYMRNENVSFYRAGEKTPKTVLG